MQPATTSAKAKELAFDKTKELIDRRKAVVANGVSIFVPSSAVSANGATIIDANGNELIDFGGGIGVVNAGHCPPPVVKAIQDQAAKLIHSSINVSTYEPYLQLCEKLVSLFPHGDKTKVMLTNTGAESVENAIKIARQATKRSAVICFSEAFHGRSMMAMTLTSKINYKIDCGPFAPEVYRLPFPNYYHEGKGMTENDFAEQELQKLHDATHSVVDPNAVAAVIIEIVQGEGGFNIVPKRYLEGLREFCDEFGIMLIFDEVQSGFCRTGKWAAYQHFGVTPDISTWAKSMGSGLPIGAVIGRQEVMDSAAVATIGGTYTGSPVCCAAAIATIKYMEEIDLNKRAQEVSKIVGDRFHKLKAKCSAIGDIRSLGAMQAIEFVENNDPSAPDSETVALLTKACLKRGLILLSAGTNKNVIRVLSPLVISDELLNKGLDILEEELLKITN
ncbi:MAG TPA: 4-aminobutyrate--2-oxoglutarate transaminase [Cytophagales bacterium]|nr:4-aminobutyrate--2-oxoglutarate transaminase [Cytophagales bacterium]HCR54987.1 4-aminobutyrate--2-oxoglutarate transaminase [Cytophagales bacterium]